MPNVRILSLACDIGYDNTCSYLNRMSILSMTCIEARSFVPKMYSGIIYARYIYYSKIGSQCLQFIISFSRSFFVSMNNTIIQSGGKKIKQDNSTKKINRITGMMNNWLFVDDFEIIQIYKMEDTYNFLFDPLQGGCKILFPRRYIIVARRRAILDRLS